MTFKPTLRPPLRLSHNSGYVRLRPCYVCQSPSTVVRSCSCSAQKSLGFSGLKSAPSISLSATLNSTSRDPLTPSTDHRTLAQSHELFMTSQYPWITSFPPQWRGHFQQAAIIPSRPVSTIRLYRSHHSDYLQEVTLGDVRPLGELCRRHV